MDSVGILNDGDKKREIQAGTQVRMETLIFATSSFQLWRKDLFNDANSHLGSYSALWCALHNSHCVSIVAQSDLSA